MLKLRRLIEFGHGYGFKGMPGSELAGLARLANFLASQTPNEVGL